MLEYSLLEHEIAPIFLLLAHSRRHHAAPHGHSCTPAQISYVLKIFSNVAWNSFIPKWSQNIVQKNVTKP